MQHAGYAALLWQKEASDMYTIWIWVIDVFCILPNVLFFQAKLYA